MSPLVVAGDKNPGLVSKGHEGPFGRSRGRNLGLGPEGHEALRSGSTGGTPWSWGCNGDGNNPLAKLRGVTAHGLHTMISEYHGFLNI